MWMWQCAREGVCVRTHVRAHTYVCARAPRAHGAVVVACVMGMAVCGGGVWWCVGARAQCRATKTLVERWTTVTAGNTKGRGTLTDWLCLPC